MVTKAKSRKSAGEPRGTRKTPSTNADSGPFRDGAIVLVTLNSPREKFWGVILGLEGAGVSVRGIELSSFEDAACAMAGGEPLSATALFFPMHRVERIELDLPDGTLPSLSQRFASRTGVDPRRALTLSIPKSRRRGA